MTIDADRDLNHFLKLALAQVRFKIQSQRTELQVEGAQRLSASEVSHLRLLEELIKEQVPNENSDSAARPAR